MNPGNFYTPSFYRQNEREIKSIGIIISMIVFVVLYHSAAPVQSIVDKAVNPAVGGVTVLYGKVTTPIYRTTGLNLGFVTPPPDQEFLFNVRLASYVNERRAGPLLDIAVDNRFPEEKRARALNAILKFETTADWVQPFLNELPKGGLLGMYDLKAPLLDALVKKIREEGGVRQPLVRAYAEVVFSFLMQVPDTVLRVHAANWLPDVIAEDAVFILAPRIAKEKEPDVQLAIEQALFEIRAISEPESAREVLMPLYRNPPWPAVKLPISVILARLGYSGAAQYVQNALQSETITKEERMRLVLGRDATPFPRQLKISEKQQKLWADMRKMREEQAKAAMVRREQIIRQERIKQAAIAKAEKAAAVPAVVEEAPVPVQKQVSETTAQQPDTKQIARVPVPVVPPAAKTVPKGFPVPGAEQPEALPSVEESVPVVESVSDESLMPPALEDSMPKARSLMNYVDIVFEVKNKEVPLFQNPGEGATGAVLPVGTKGKADFEVLIGDDRWYQVKTKKGNGWANGKNLSVFNLSPGSETPAVVKKTPKGDGMDGGRKESTYFTAAAENVSIFSKANENSQQDGVLNFDTAYLAVRSEKVGTDRWFLLEINSEKKGWVRGIDLQLADVQQPVELETPTEPLSQRGKPSAFAAEYVMASVKGVGVYAKPSISAKMVRQIDPPTVYKVVETSADGGKEWYRIELPGKKQGWVQTMDVNLTKPE